MMILPRKIKSRRIASAIRSIVFILCFSALSFSSVSADDGHTEARILVHASGADCTAVLYDSSGRETARIRLKDGDSGIFTVDVDSGTDVVYYTVRLSDADTDAVTYDSTVYTVRIEVYSDGSGETDCTVSAVPEGTGTSDADAKAEHIDFHNTEHHPPVPAVPHTPDTGDNADPVSWAVVSCVALVGLAVSAAFRVLERRRDRKSPL